MKKIQDMEWVNQISPYHITEINDNVFHFNTILGNKYEIALVHYLNIGSHPLDYIYITKFEKNSSGGRDGKLALTIPTLVNAYIKENSDALLMFCHKDSPKSEVYQRIFIGWYRTYLQHFPECNVLYKVFHGLDIHGYNQHFVIFYNSKCSQLNAVLQSLEEYSDKVIQLYYERRLEIDDVLHNKH